MQPSLDEMVDRLVRRGILRTPRIEDAFRQVPRHVFLPGKPPEQVYRGGHVTTKAESGTRLSSSTGPWLMAGMLEQLQPKAGERILEIGAGTGYNAALLARLVGESGLVSTLDVDAEVADEARRHLLDFGLTAFEQTSKTGYAPIEVQAADGALGDPENAPFDAILVTVRSGHIARAFFEQLIPGGRLVVPLALGGVRAGELSIAFTKKDGHLESTSMIDCGFIRPRGGMALSDRELQLDEEPGLYWCDGGVHDVPAAEIRAVLEGPREIHSVDLHPVDLQPADLPSAAFHASPDELIRGFQTWLVLHDTETCTLQAEGAWARWPRLLPMKEIPGRVKGAGGLLDGHGIALLAFENTPVDDRPAPLSIAAYGADAEDRHDIAGRLREHLHAWHAAGRPSRDRLRLRFFPEGSHPAERAGHLLLRQVWGWLEAAWSI